MSNRGTYVFEVKDGKPKGDGTFVGDESAWIYCQPTESELGIVGEGHLSLRCRPGTPYETVQDLARRLMELKVEIDYTPHR